MRSKSVDPIKIFEINNTYIIGVYQGKISKYDLLLKYRQRDKLSNLGWSRIRTPKHIHWAVDALIKMQKQKTEMKKFIDFLIKMWNNEIKPIKNKKERNTILNTKKIMKEIDTVAKNYLKLANKGEYSIKFLYLIAKLLMVQEKTNLNNAYMFKKLLESLKDHKDIYKIVSIATHNRKND